MRGKEHIRAANARIAFGFCFEGLRVFHFLPARGLYSILYDLFVVECKRRQALKRMTPDLCRVGICRKHPPGFFAQIGRRYGMPSRIPFRVGIDSKKARYLDHKTRLLIGLSFDGLLNSLSVFYETAGKSPHALERRVLSPYEDNGIVVDYHRVDRQLRGFEGHFQEKKSSSGVEDAAVFSFSDDSAFAGSACTSKGRFFLEKRKGLWAQPDLNRWFSPCQGDVITGLDHGPVAFSGDAGCDLSVVQFRAFSESARCAYLMSPV